MRIINGFIYYAYNCTLHTETRYGVFPLPDSYSETYSVTDSDSMQKCSTGTDSDGHSYGQFLWKLLKSHLIGTDIGAKMGTVPIGIGIGICIGIGVGSVETLLHITIVAIFYRYRNRNRNRAVETHQNGTGNGTGTNGLHTHFLVPVLMQWVWAITDKCERVLALTFKGWEHEAIQYHRLRSLIFRPLFRLEKNT